MNEIRLYFHSFSRVQHNLPEAFCFAIVQYIYLYIHMKVFMKLLIPDWIQMMTASTDRETSQTTEWRILNPIFIVAILFFNPLHKCTQFNCQTPNKLCFIRVCVCVLECGMNATTAARERRIVVVKANKIKSIYFLFIPYSIWVERCHPPPSVALRWITRLITLHQQTAISFTDTAMNGSQWSKSSNLEMLVITENPMDDEQWHLLVCHGFREINSSFVQIVTRQEKKDD